MKGPIALGRRSPPSRYTLVTWRHAFLVVGASIVWAICYRAFRPGSLEGDPNQLAVVIPFSPSSLHQISTDFDSWKAFPPCAGWKPRSPSLFLYSVLPGPSEEAEELLRKLPQRVKTCFGAIGVLEHANTTLTPKSTISEAFSAYHFYQLFLSPFPSATSHIFTLLPSTRPVKKYWATHLANSISNSEPFWVRGTADSSALGHLNGNSVFAVHDPLARSFYQKIMAGRFADEPFDQAWYKYLRSPGKERYRREHLAKFVYSELVQDATNVEESAYPSRTFFVIGQTAQRTDLNPMLQSSTLDPALVALLDRYSTVTKTINLAFSTAGYREMLLNYVHFVKKAGMNYLIITMDDGATDLCAKHGIPHYAAGTGASEESDSYTSSGFRAVVNKRSRLISNILRAGYNILQSDLDVIWFKNPFPFFFNGDFEYEIQSDARVGFSENDPQAPFEEFVNSGVFYAKGTPHMADFYDVLVDTIDENPNRREQYLLNTVVAANELDINYRIMDPSLFPNGFQYFVRTLPQRAGVNPFALHANWIDGKDIKKYRFREVGAWTQDPPEYSDPINGRYIVALEPTTENNGWNNVRNSLRAGMAIAQITGRTLILPAMYSYHNRSATVTLDYFIDYKAFAANFPNFREHSFAERVFPDPPKSVVHIALSPGAGPTYDPPTKTQTFWAKGYHRGPTDAEVRSWLAPMKDEPIIYLSALFRRFHKFELPVDNAAFDEMIGKALEPSSIIKDVSGAMAKVLMQDAKAAGGTGYNCAHIRRGDFVDVHKEKTMEELVKILASKMNTTETLYVTSDESDSREFRELIMTEFPKARFLPEFVEMFPEMFGVYHERSDGHSMLVGAIEQRVCSWGKTFTGNIYSTFTTHICYLRHKMGHRGAGLCPDIYDRPYSTDWEFF